MNNIESVMNAEQAQAWQTDIIDAAGKFKVAGDRVRLLLIEGKSGRAWVQLGYASWQQCRDDIANKAKLSVRHVQRLDAANEIQDSIMSTSDQWSKVDIIPEGTLRPLSGLAVDDQREAWRIANETAPNGNLTGAHVKRVVDEYLTPKGNERFVDEHPTDEAADFDAGDDPLYEQWYEEETGVAREEGIVDDNLIDYADTMIRIRAKEERAKAQSNYITLEQWGKLDETDRLELLSADGDKQFNKQNSDNIEWARWSWNPITGCLHGCEYCYARDIANRFYPQGFAPSLIPERLTAPANTTAPDVARFDDPIDQIGWRNVFTCSMADLFGKWVPDEWIDAVLQQARDNPQWTFLMLTKFPIRMAEFDFPPNTWIGTTVDRQWSVDRAEKAFRKIRDNGYQGVAWLSCEPMMEDLNFSALDMFDWVVMGGSSRSTQTPDFRPPFPWIVNLWTQAKRYDLPVYMKTNLGIEQRVREYPIRVPTLHNPQ